MNTASQLLLDQVRRQRVRQAQAPIVAVPKRPPLVRFVDTKTGEIHFVEYRGP